MIAGVHRSSQFWCFNVITTNNKLQITIVNINAYAFCRMFLFPTQHVIFVKRGF